MTPPQPGFRYWLERAICAAQASDIDGALDNLDRAILLNPTARYLWISRPRFCCCPARLHELPFYDLMFAGAPKKGQNPTPSILTRGLEHYQKNEYTLAAGCFHKVLEDPALPPFVLEVLASLFSNLAMQQEATECLERLPPGYILHDTHPVDPVADAGSRAGECGDRGTEEDHPSPGNAPEIPGTCPDPQGPVPSPGTGGDVPEQDSRNQNTGSVPGSVIPEPERAAARPAERTPGPTAEPRHDTGSARDTPAGRAVNRPYRPLPAGELRVPGGAGAIPFLAHRLREDPDPAVRLAALNALATRQDPEAVSSLIGALHDEDERIRNRTAGILRQFPGKDVTIALTGILRDPDQDVRCAARESLRSRNDPDAIGPIVRLFTLTTSEDLARLVASHGEAALPILECSLADPGRSVRIQSCHALEQIASPRSAIILRQALGDPDRDVRMAAIRGLAIRGTPDRFDLLAEAFRDGDTDTRCTVIDILARIPCPQSRSLLVAALKDPAARVRYMAVDMLRRYHDPDLASIVAPLLHDRNMMIAGLAGIQLGGLGYPAFSVLAEALGAAESEQAAGACRNGLCSCGNPGVSGILVGFLSDSRWNMRAAAAYALHWLKDETAKPRLVELLDDHNPEVRRAAAGALSVYGTGDVRELLAAHAGDPDPGVRTTIEQILMHHTTEPL